MSRYGSRWPSTPMPAAASAAARLGAREVRSPAQRVGERLVPTPQGGGVEAELPVPVRAPRLHARRGRGEQPADVGRQHEVPGRPQHVGAQDAAGGEGLLDRVVVRAAPRAPTAHLAGP